MGTYGSTHWHASTTGSSAGRDRIRTRSRLLLKLPRGGQRRRWSGSDPGAAHARRRWRWSSRRRQGRRGPKAPASWWIRGVVSRNQPAVLQSQRMTRRSRRRTVSHPIRRAVVDRKERARARRREERDGTRNRGAGDGKEALQVDFGSWSTRKEPGANTRLISICNPTRVQARGRALLLAAFLGLSIHFCPSLQPVPPCPVPTLTILDLDRSSTPGSARGRPAGQKCSGPRVSMSSTSHCDTTSPLISPATGTRPSPSIDVEMRVAECHMLLVADVTQFGLSVFCHWSRHSKWPSVLSFLRSHDSLGAIAARATSRARSPR